MKIFIEILSYGILFILTVIAAVIGAEAVSTLIDKILNKVEAK